MSGSMVQPLSFIAFTQPLLSLTASPCGTSSVRVSVTDMRHAFLSWHKAGSRNCSLTACILMQRTFGHLALSHRPFFLPRGFWQSFKDYDGEPTNVREHQDAYEFFTRLQVCPRLVCTDSGLPRHSSLAGH